MSEFQIRRNADAVAGLVPAAVVAMVERATRSTFYADGLSPEQEAANGRIPGLGATTFYAAAGNVQQHLAAAFRAGQLAGFVVATRHGPLDHELDWLMVDPAFHGSGVAALLMAEGIEWLGTDRPMWLTVIRHNARAIAFYRRFGFEVDESTELGRPVPSWVMRRPGGGSLPRWRNG